MGHNLSKDELIEIGQRNQIKGKIQIILENKNIIEDIDIEQWIKDNQNLPYFTFFKIYHNDFGYLDAYIWDKVKEKKNLSYTEYKLARKKEDMLFEEKYNEMKRKDKMIEEMWDKYPLTTDFKVTEGEPITFGMTTDKITEDKIEKANITMDEHNFEEIAKVRTTVWDSEKDKDYKDMQKSVDKFVKNLIKEEREEKDRKGSTIASKKDDSILIFSEREQQFKILEKENGKYSESKSLTKEKEEKYKKEMDSFFNMYGKSNYQSNWNDIESVQSIKNRTKEPFTFKDSKKQDIEMNKSIENKKYKETIKNTYYNISSELDSMEEKILNSEGFEEDEIQSIKERIKLVENRLKEKVKPKTITISNNLHNIINNYCNFYNIKIGDWVEKTLLEKIEENTPRKETITIEQARQELENKYISNGVWKNLVSSDKLLDLNKNYHKFKFVGFGVNKKPIYDYIGTSFEDDIKTIGCNVTKLEESKVLIAYKYNTDFAVELDEGVYVPEVDPSDDRYIKKLKSMNYKDLSKEIDDLIKWAQTKK